MRFETLFFDLDGTLYPEDNGLWDAIKARIDRYLLEVMGFTPQEARRLRKVFMQQYGTTLRGLQTEFHIDAEHYLAYVHDLPLDQYLAPNPALRGLLLGLSARRWIFTNSDAGHAGRVLDALGLAGCFEGIIDIRALEFICKPDPQAYQIALRRSQAASPQTCLMLDDAPVNLQPARQMGFGTVLVSRNGAESAADCKIPCLEALPQALPELWRHG